MNKIITVLILVALPALLAFSPRLSAVALGNIELEGGTESVTVSTGAITPGQGDELVGTITNSTGRPIDDVTVEVVRDDEESSPPTSDGDSTVTDPAGSSSGDNVEGDEGFTANINLTGAAGAASPLGHSGSADLGIDVGNTGDGSDVEVKVTPSVGNKPTGDFQHADVLLSFDLSGPAPGATHSLSHPFHDRASVFITNDGDDDIVSFTGKCTLPSGVSLSSVHLQDPSASYASVLGTSTSINGSLFDVTGFTKQKPGTTYELVLVLSGVPSDEYDVYLEASF